MIRKAAMLAAAAIAGTGLWAEDPAAEVLPSFERLLELNARELFGGEVTAKEGRLTIKYTGKGSFSNGFRATGGKGKGFIAELNDLKDIQMKGKLTGGIENNFSLAGLDSGDALSKFEMADDIKVTFKLKAEVVPPGASIILRLHQQDQKAFIQTSFFQEITVRDGGKPRSKLTADKRFNAVPSKWFLQKHSPTVPVEMAFKDRKASVRVSLFSEKEKSESVETVSIEDIDGPTHGRIGLRFSKISFGMADLVIEGKVHRPWAEAEIERLKKEGKLKLKPEEEVAKKDDKPAKTERRERPGGAKGKGGDAEPKRPVKPKRGQVKIDEPDPESDDEL